MGDGSGTSNDSSSTFPPVGSPDRYDMIVQRGRTLRRRRRYKLGAGAGGTVVALAVAVVLISNGGSDDSDANATKVNEFANEGTSDAIVETTTSLPMPAQMTVTIDVDSSTILVQDPAQVAHDDAKQCVYLELTGPDGTIISTGHGCSTSPAPVELPLLDGVQLTCPPQMVRYEPAALSTPETEPRSSTYVYDLDPAIPAGSYDLTVQAVSGLTDGCPGTDPQFERENPDDDTQPIELP